MSKGESEKVGYGQPPKATRFKPGQSGNPTGRAKGKKSLKTILMAEFSRLIEVQMNGRKRRITRGEFLIKRAFSDGLGGSQRARKQILDLMMLFERQEPPPAREIPTREEDLALLRRYLPHLEIIQKRRSPNEQD